MAREEIKHPDVIGFQPDDEWCSAGVGGDLTHKALRTMALQADLYWKETRYDYDAGGQVTYEGRNTTHKAATDVATWYIWKQTWSAVPGNLTRRQGPLVGTWDGRAALSW